jgi:hypothetical protein
MSEVPMYGRPNMTSLVVPYRGAFGVPLLPTLGGLM